MIDEDDLAARIVDPLAADTAEVALLRGRYELLEPLGEGGQGRVLRAWDHHHRRAVALKIRPIGADDDRERLLAEARALVGLQPHRNVAVIRDDFFEGDHHYLVLDWIAGDDLKSRLRREGVPGLPFELVAAVVGDIAEALDHLHGHEPPIVHGDVKPGNIVVSDGDPPHAVLVDFGLASQGEREVSGGTLAYAAPETLVGIAPSPRSDVYSLSATTFELLTGRVPGPSATLDWSSVPTARIPAVRSALVAGLAVDPDQRPPTAGRFLELLTDGSPGARSALRRRTSRLRRRLIVVGTVVVAALVGAAAAQLLDEDQRPLTATSAAGDGEEVAPSQSLPSGEARVGKVGIYSSRGVFETYDVGDAGSLVAVERQEGLTSNWDAITRLDDDVLLFYRGRDAYAVAVQWPDDGAVLDLYSPPDFGFGWTHLTRLAPGWLHLHDSSTGNETLITYDDEVNLLTTEALPPSRPGWTHLVRLADASLLRYDAATGTAVLTTFDADRAPAGDTPVSGFEPGLDGLVVTDDGRVLVRTGDGLRLLAIDGSTARVVDELEVEATWTEATTLPGGGVLLYDPPSGRARVVSIDGDELSAGDPVDALPAGVVLIGRP